MTDGTLDALEERRQAWREQRDRGEVALDALMPIETEQEKRWKYWVKQPALTPLYSGRGAGGEGELLPGEVRPYPLTPSPVLGEGGQESLPILYLSAYSGDRPDSKDNLLHLACQPLHQAWAEHGSAIAPGKPLRDWLRLNFFKDVHVGMYEQRPIYFPTRRNRPRLHHR